MLLQWSFRARSTDIPCWDLTKAFSASCAARSPRQFTVYAVDIPGDSMSPQCSIDRILPPHPCSESSDWIIGWVCLEPLSSHSSKVQGSATKLALPELLWRVPGLDRTLISPGAVLSVIPPCRTEELQCTVSEWLGRLHSASQWTGGLTGLPSAEAVLLPCHSTDFSLLTMKPRASRRNINTSKCCIAASLDSDSRRCILWWLNKWIS